MQQLLNLDDIMSSDIDRQVELEHMVAAALGRGPEIEGVKLGVLACFWTMLRSPNSSVKSATLVPQS